MDSMVSRALDRLKQAPQDLAQARLFRELPAAAAPEELGKKAEVLDDSYIPARCPNGHPEGARFAHQGPLQSEAAGQR